uniref:Odorant receptor n=1 Tax=Heliothis virescens TaxID=7102 RepID=A0A2A4J5V4_HELVI
MDHFSGYYKSSKTTEFLINLNQFVFIFGLPNFWVQELDISDSFRKIVGYFNKYGNWSIFGLILAEYGAFFTQKNLNQRQSSDLVLFMISHSIITGFRVRICHQEVEIRNVMYKLGIALKEVHNDSDAEEQMIKRSKFFSWALILNCVMSFLMYTIEAVLRVIRVGVTFTTVITVYPDVEDRSGLSNGVRVICTGDIQKICRDVFSGQIIFNITLLIIVLMYQMVNSARSLTNALTLVMVALSILLSTGFFMWNAGDITVEAKSLPTAMFSSGWEHCGRDSSVRVRKLIVIAMMQAQEPVVLTGLGIIALSYQSYVSIVKSSYSVFSVLY